MRTYKGFNKDLSCRGFRYEVGKEYEIEGNIRCCETGFHACESPLEVFDHYNMIDSRFCEVEQSGEIEKDENSTKVCSSEIKIVAELKLADMIRLGVEWLKEITSPQKVKNGSESDNDNGKNSAQIGSSGYSAQIGSSGYSAQIGSSGYSAQIGSSGDYAKIGSSGDSAQIGSSGYSAKIGSSGNYAKIGSSGNSAQIGSSGYSAQIGSSGNYAKIGSSGDSAQIGSSGYSAKIESTGDDSVICCAGNNSCVKAKNGSWITLAEWVYDNIKERYVPKCVKTEYVDGERIKADTWYRLKDGEFVTVN